MADKFIQMSQRNAGNTDWDNLFPSTKFETAGGTATAITVTIPSLADGVSKTFVAKSSNSAAATTINGKHLYKPNTTTAPTLIAGKAYTVWYSASNDCFFIKASATGTVTSDKVLAGETYSTEDDTDLVGTMDLQAENIRKGIVYGGIMGTLDIESLGGKKWASGQFTLIPDGGTSTRFHYTVSNLLFKPSLAIVKITVYGHDYLATMWGNISQNPNNLDTAHITSLNNNGFSFITVYNAGECSWIAIE
jgi:hypothetical protein